MIKGTTNENPYDATSAGPMCEQSNRSPDSVEDLNEVNINDAVANILEVTVVFYFFRIPLSNFFIKDNFCLMN